MSLTPLQQNRLQRMLDTNGFLLPRGFEGDWLLADAQYARARAWIRYAGEPGGDSFLIAIREPHVARAFEDEGGHALAGDHPKDAASAFLAQGDGAAHRTLRRLFQLARSLPDALLDRFHEQVRDLHRQTEAERLVVLRVGQNLFREVLLDLQNGRCALTGLDQPELLRASHIKPWSACDTDEDRLNPDNGLLLAAHWNAAFDQGLVTFEDDGRVRASSTLTNRARALLDLTGDNPPTMALRRGQHAFLEHHRAHVWRG